MLLRSRTRGACGISLLRRWPVVAGFLALAACEMAVSGGNSQGAHAGTARAATPTQPRADLLFVQREGEGAGEVGRYGRVVVERWTGAGAEALTPRARAPWFPKWSPSGDCVSFIEERTGADGMAHYELHVWGAANGSDTVLATPELSSTAKPAWAPDGGAIVVATGLRGDEGLWAVDWPSGEGRRLTDGEGVDRRPLWSPDGQQIVLTRRAPEGYLAVVLELVSRRERVVSAPGEDCSDARWIGQAGDLCYVAGREDTTALVMLRAADAERTELAALTGAIWEITPSPDGKMVAASVTEKASGRISIEFVPAGVGEGFSVPSPAAAPLPPLRLAWSRDGRFLAFDADMGGQRDVFVLNVESRMLERVTDGPDDEMYPDWRPIVADAAADGGGH